VVVSTTFSAQLPGWLIIDPLRACQWSILYHLFRSDSLRGRKTTTVGLFGGYFSTTFFSAIAWMVENRPPKGLLMVDFQPRSRLKGVEYRTPHREKWVHRRTAALKSTTFSERVVEKLPPFLKKW
jgi:hypothetical protein